MSFKRMWFKHPAWIFVAWVLCVLNLVSVWFAAQPGEAWHASTHALFALLFGLGAYHLQVRRQRIAAASDAGGRLRELEEQLANRDPRQIEQALDAIAIEVERIGESQRFLTKLAVGQSASPSLDAQEPQDR